jgi:molybdopterin/thiamine biosynthesis adenylyltransferase
MDQIIASDRIREGGVNVSQLQAKNVVIKVEDIPDQQLQSHPLTALCRAIGRLGVQSLQVHGSPKFFDSLADDLHGAPSFSQLPGPWFADLVPPQIAAVDMLIDLSNSISSNNISAKLAESVSIPFHSLTWGKTWVRVTSSTASIDQACDFLKSQVFGGPPLLPISRIACGLVLQEFLIKAGQCDLAIAPEQTVFFNAADETRTGVCGVTWPEIALENVTLDIVGAGGIGVHLLESLTPLLSSSCLVRIFDPDVIESENLAMQITYSPEDVGMPKAVVMAHKLAAYCQANIQAFEVDYQSRPSNLSVPSLRVVCADNFEARYQANEFSLADGVPLLDSGSSPLAARVSAYYPGKTACLAHHIPGLAQKAEEERERASCSQNHSPTLPGTNMVCGGMLACEAMRVLRPDLYGYPSTGTILYDARFPHRFGVVSQRPPCRHEVSR